MSMAIFEIKGEKHGQRSFNAVIIEKCEGKEDILADDVFMLLLLNAIKNAMPD